MHKSGLTLSFNIQSAHSSTCKLVRLLGPCFKTGHTEVASQRVGPGFLQSPPTRGRGQPSATRPGSSSSTIYTSSRTHNDKPRGTHHNTSRIYLWQLELARKERTSTHNTHADRNSSIFTRAWVVQKTMQQSFETFCYSVCFSCSKRRLSLILFSKSFS